MFSVFSWYARRFIFCALGLQCTQCKNDSRLLAAKIIESSGQLEAIQLLLIPKLQFFCDFSPCSLLLWTCLQITWTFFKTGDAVRCHFYICSLLSRVVHFQYGTLEIQNQMTRPRMFPVHNRLCKQYIWKTETCPIQTTFSELNN